ncbi:hypothetical protein, partial [Mycobacterium avium]
GQWVGSLLTGFSLILAFNVLRINQRDKRIAQASLIVFTNYYTSVMDENFYLVTIRGTIHNHSSALITNTAIVVEMTKRLARQRLSLFDRWFRPHRKVIAHYNIRIGDDINGTLLPEKSTNYFVEISYEAEVTAEDVVIKLTFMDANSVTWDRVIGGAPTEPKLPGRLRSWIITRLRSKDWETEIEADKLTDESADGPE